MLSKEALAELGKRINGVNDLDMDDIILLLQEAGEVKKWQITEGDTFESIIFRACDLLGIEVF